MREIVAAENGCLVWGGHANLSPADEVLISVERPLSIDTPEQMVASILSKKLASGSTHLVLEPLASALSVLTDDEKELGVALVEMGAGTIQPVLTRFTQVSRLKHERLVANAIEAAEQCEVLSVPTVEPEVTLERLLDGWPGDRVLIFADSLDCPGCPWCVI